MPGLRSIILLISTLVPGLVVPGAERSDIDELIAAGQYQSALDLLEARDPTNEDPQLFAKKVDVAVNYYALCLDNEIFALRDLAADEELSAIRGKPGTYKMYDLDIDANASKLIERFPEDGNLRKALADWYYNGAEICGLDPETRAEAESSYQEARRLGIVDFQSLHNLGVLLLERDEVEGGLAVLNESLKLNDRFAGTQYNIAYANLLLQNPLLVATHAEQAFKLYSDEKLKSEAALLAAIGFVDSGERAKALEFAGLADQYKYGNHYFILTQLLRLYIETNEWEKTASAADRLFALEPENPRLVQDVMAAYGGATKKEGLEGLDRFFQRNLEVFKDDSQGRGNLLFHRAHFWHEKGETGKAIQDLELARASFATVLEPSHEVFRAIESLLADLTR